MASTVQRLSEKINPDTKRPLAEPPKWLPMNVHYETIMGSIAYGVSSDESDFDVYGLCIPPKEEVFPHLKGEIVGFGRNQSHFEQYQQHHVWDQDDLGGKGRNYDLSIYNIVKYFMLCMENNPNMIDSLYTPQFCVLHITKVGQMIRESRNMFLHKGAWHKFKGYAYSQLHKMDTKETEGKRKELRDKFGFDVKYAYHVVRLMDECEQILTLDPQNGTLDIQRNREQLKSIRRGEWTVEQIKAWASAKEPDLEKLYHKEDSKLPYAPDERKVKTLLLQCLEEHYGSLDKCIVAPDIADQTLNEIEKLVEKYRRLTR